MPSMEERVAYLEGRVEDHHGAMADLRTDPRTDIRDIRSDIRDVRTDIGGLRVEFQVEIRELRADMIRQLHAMDTKINWVIGGQLVTALAVLGALLKR